MIKYSKLPFYKVLQQILKRRKKDIVAVEHELPRYKIISISSTGEIIYEAENDEKLIITFETNKKWKDKIQGVKCL